MTANFWSLLQTIIWIGMIVFLLTKYEKSVFDLFSILLNRFKTDDFKIGPGGIDIQTPKIPSEVPKSVRETPAAINAMPESKAKPIYMVHKVRRAQSLDKEDREFYRIWIWIDADSRDLLRKVISVEYHLHETFREPIRVVERKRDNDSFYLQTAGWGEFNMWAEVKFNDGSSVNLERYISFN